MNTIIDEDDIDLAQLLAANPMGADERPYALSGITYALLVSNGHQDMVKVFLTLCERDGRLSEVFINTKDEHLHGRVDALMMFLTRLLQDGKTIESIVEDLQNIFDPTGGHFLKGGRYAKSVEAHIGYVLQDHVTRGGVAGMLPTLLQQPITAKE